jgi:hypothetical protein
MWEVGSPYRVKPVHLDVRREMEREGSQSFIAELGPC